eukprot:Plantae.Rhodophyta-Purpureofilum_apyrenoidigerum.ctg20846.p1 GENE.Plantae.Rhodophyta-Purpureofilum_apyrenoidigerum.ctg20846~~Plantae.Rhodophyta-Purpureofilum_apyrenoidigerum.ctg20846.p1  ORF type:complete len:304 (+),score=71.58 Plantae.Rhodophyta-Purpureofilum_apyrenoidigerum.ctg20846:65-976(+)
MEMETIDFDTYLFDNLDALEPVPEPCNTGLGSSLFDDVMYEVDLEMNDDSINLGNLDAVDDGFLMPITELVPVDDDSEDLMVELRKNEATLGEELEKYKDIYANENTLSVLEEVSTPLSSNASDSSSLTTLPASTVEDALSGTMKAPRKRQQTTKPKLFACHLCTSTFTARFNLNKHIRTVHENLRPFHCDVCNASFQQKCHLKQHKTTVHEHKRPYKCEICSLSFGWPAVLNKHIRLKHEKQRPFSCNLCNSTFQQKTHLTQHLIALHEKKKPFSCEHCTLTFNRKERLKKHLQTVHNIDEA